MLQPSQRKVLLLNGHPMVKGYSFGAPSAQYLIHRTVPPRWSAMRTNSFLAIRELHRSNSQVSVKELTSLKASTSGELKTQMRPDSAKHPTSVIQALYAVQWSSLFGGCRQRLTLENAVSFARKLPSNVAAGYTMVKDSREYELVQKTVIAMWRASPASSSRPDLENATDVMPQMMLSCEYIASSWSARMSNSLQVASSEPVANACPFGKKVTALMSLSCPGNVCLHWPSRMSHSFAFASHAPDTNVLLWGATDSAITSPRAQDMSPELVTIWLSSRKRQHDR
uniref:Uncharacterized protein n=1 Tax=Anopheles atroparvus TaxID=41427 RepID=A0A182JJA3_ANOAO